MNRFNSAAARSKLVLLVAALGTTMAIPSVATALVAGDIAIIGYSADQSGDPFAWVPLVAIPGNAEVFSTDAGWTATDTFRAGEGAIKFTAPAAGLSAGTIMQIGSSSSVISGQLPAGLGSYVTESGGNFTGNYLFATPGDNLFVFDGPIGSPNFIFGMKNEGTVFEGDATSNDSSALPSGLTIGSTAMVLGGPGETDNFDNGRYTGTTTGTRADLLAAITTPSNWERGGSPRTPDATATNSGDAGTTLIGSIAAVTGSADFSSTTQAFSLSQGASQSSTVTYTPGQRGGDSGTVSVTSNGGNADLSVSGTGVAPQVGTITGGDAANVRVGTTGTATVSVPNVGDGNLLGLP